MHIITISNIYLYNNTKLLIESIYLNCLEKKDILIEILIPKNNLDYFTELLKIYDLNINLICYNKHENIELIKLTTILKSHEEYICCLNHDAIFIRKFSIKSYILNNKINSKNIIFKLSIIKDLYNYLLNNNSRLIQIFNNNILDKLYIMFYKINIDKYPFVTWIDKHENYDLKFLIKNKNIFLINNENNIEFEKWLNLDIFNKKIGLNYSYLDNKLNINDMDIIINILSETNDNLLIDKIYDFLFILDRNNIYFYNNVIIGSLKNMKIYYSLNDKMDIYLKNYYIFDNEYLIYKHLNESNISNNLDPTLGIKYKSSEILSIYRANNNNINFYNREEDYYLIINPDNNKYYISREKNIYYLRETDNINNYIGIENNILKIMDKCKKSEWIIKNIHNSTKIIKNNFEEYDNVNIVGYDLYKVDNIYSIDELMILFENSYATCVSYDKKNKIGYFKIFYKLTHSGHNKNLTKLDDNYITFIKNFNNNEYGKNMILLTIKENDLKYIKLINKLINNLSNNINICILFYSLDDINKIIKLIEIKNVSINIFLYDNKITKCGEINYNSMSILWLLESLEYDKIFILDNNSLFNLMPKLINNINSMNINNEYIEPMNNIKELYLYNCNNILKTNFINILKYENLIITKKQHNEIYNYLVNMDITCENLYLYYDIIPINILYSLFLLNNKI